MNTRRSFLRTALLGLCAGPILLREALRAKEPAAPMQPQNYETRFGEWAEAPLMSPPINKRPGYIYRASDYSGEIQWMNVADKNP